MGFLVGQIGKISTIGIKSQVAMEFERAENQKKQQVSWPHGAMVQAQPGSQVHIHNPANGVAVATPPE